jgi:hypothetical protein
VAVLLTLAAPAGPGAIAPAHAQGGPVAQGVPPPTAAEARRAAELRRVARDALAGKDQGVDLDEELLGIGGVAWRVLAVLLVVLVVVVGIALARRGPRRRRDDAAAVTARDDAAAELERLARQAEEAGEHRAAVVLWFRAGTRRLRERRRVRVDVAATAAQVARESGDPRVATLAAEHDRAAYGPGPVPAEASRGAREGWTAVLHGPADDGPGAPA